MAVAFAFVAAPSPGFAGTTPPFDIDGTIPDAGCPGSTSPDPATNCVQLTDPAEGAKELGPVNSSETKLGSIHTATPAMLGFTNPNGSTDIVNIWLETAKDADNDIWLYFAWQRDSNSGSSVISYEFQQTLLDANCDYSLTDQQEPLTADETTLINSCNPWAGRAEDDFLIVWDFGGGATDIVLRTFDGAVFDAGMLVTDPSLSFAEAALNGDTSRGEGAINLSDSIFSGLPDSCLTVANIIPGTITGNSDSADYKDTLLADLNAGIAISNCGTVTVTKNTIPGALDGTFPYTLDRPSGSIMYPADVVPGPCDTTGCSDVLTSDGDSDFIRDLIPNTDYQLVENLDGASKFLLKSIVCDGKDVTATGSTFPVAAANNTACTITNELGTGTVTVIKDVVNIIPDSASPSDFCLSLDGGQSSFAGASSPGSQFTYVDGTSYTVTEVACGDPDTSPAGYLPSFEGDCDSTIEAFKDKTCTVTNTQQEQNTAALTLFKNLVTDNGGTASTSDWTLSASLKSGAPLTCGASGFSGQDVEGAGVPGSVSVSDPLATCVYELAETGGPSNYTAMGWSCTGDHTLTNGNELTVSGSGPVTCTITNDDDAPSLTLVKNVTRNNGGTADATDWMLTASGPTPISGPGGATSDATFSAGTYALSESGGPAGYTAGAWTCTNGVTVDAQGQISIGLGQTTTCSITNDDDAPSLTLVKNVTKNNGGTADATDWTLTASGPTPISGLGGATSDATFSAGTYALSEGGGPAGYTAGAWTCTNGIAVDAQGQITLTEGQSTTCSITNDDDAPSLTLVKALVTDNAGTALATSWTLAANGPTPISGAGGATSDATFSAGTYALSESGGPAGYTAGGWSCTNGITVDAQGQITLIEGQSTVCTIVNDDIAPSLTLVKQVVKDNGGTAVATDWTLTADGPSPISGPGGANSDDTFLVGTYTLSESGGPAGYAAGGWNCTNGVTVDGQGQITLTEGLSTVCTIVNDDIQPTLTLVKSVINDDHPEGFGLGPDDFGLAISGSERDPIAVTSGTPLALNAGDYTASEVNQAGYMAGDWTGDCGTTGNVTLIVGDNKTCTIENDDIPPELKIVKTPDLSDEIILMPGQDALYTISVTNIGGGDAYGVTLADNLPNPGNGMAPLSWHTTTPGCTITEDVNLFCDVGFLEKDPTPEQKESGDENGFSATVIARIPPDFLFSLGTPGGSGTIGSNFEIDGNMVLDGTSPPLIDWENGAAVAASVEGFFVNELDPPIADLSPDFDTDNSFTEGTKNDDEHPVVEDKSVPPNKSDLTNFLITQDIVDGNLYLVLGWIRANSLGTSNFDFELNQSNALSDNGITPLRTDGDVLISFDFEGSEGLEGLALTLRFWDESIAKWGAPRDLNAEGIAFGAVNDPVIFGTDPQNEPDVINGGVLGNNTFGEAIVNLTKAFSDDCKVFLQAYVKGRSSNSFTSSMKDFISPVDVEVSSCVVVDLPNVAEANALNHEQVTDSGQLSVTNDTDLADPDSEPGVSAAVTDLFDSGSSYGMARWSDVEDTYMGSVVESTTADPGVPVMFQSDALIDFGSLEDVSENGAIELVTLGIRDDGVPRVQIRDSETGAFVKNQLFFMKGLSPMSMETLADLGNDGSDDIAVLAERDSSGEIVVQIRDGKTGAMVRNVFFLNPAWRAIQLLKMDGFDSNPGQELGVLAVDPEGRLSMMIKDAATNTFVNNVFFLNSDWSAIQAVAMPDANGNGAPEVVLLAKNKVTGKVVAMIRDAKTDEFLGNVFPLGSDWMPSRVVVIPDENSNGAAELATLGVNLNSGKLIVEINDSHSGNQIRVLEPLGSNWNPIDMIGLEDVGTGSAGLLIMATQKVGGMDVAQTVDSVSGEVVSNLVLD
jgi:uncharacterized repeat protein (TIGR01451 family)